MADQESPALMAGSEYYTGPFSFNADSGKVWMPSRKGGQTFCLDIRGWGYLTGGGSGALGLSQQEAVAAQHAFGEWLVRAMNAATQPEAPSACDHILIDDADPESGSIYRCTKCGAQPGKKLGHDEAIQALIDCASTVTVLSYQEAIEGYFKLRGLPIPK